MFRGYIMQSEVVGTFKFAFQSNTEYLEHGLGTVDLGALFVVSNCSAEILNYTTLVFEPVEAIFLLQLLCFSCSESSEMFFKQCQSSSSVLPISFVLLLFFFRHLFLCSELQYQKEVEHSNLNWVKQRTKRVSPGYYTTSTHSPPQKKLAIL